MIRVIIVDDHAVVRSGLEQFLATTGDIELVGTAADGLEAIEVTAATSPDVVVMDLSMPNLDGVEATRRISAEHPSSRVLVLTSFSDRTRIMDALSAGADGYLLKHSDPEEIAAAIRSVHTGDAPLDPKAARALLESRRTATESGSLTDRERQVLDLVRQGSGEQTDRPQARDQRTHGQGTLDERVLDAGRQRPDPSRAVGIRTPRSRLNLARTDTGSPVRTRRNVASSIVVIIVVRPGPAVLRA